MCGNRSAVLRGVGDVVIEDRAVPEVGDGEVLVRIDAVGVCGSDIHYFEHGRIGDFVVESPMILGHESAGEVVAVGRGVDEARIGQIVALEPGLPDRTCSECLAGRYNLCPNVRFFATPPIDGSMAQYVAFDALFAHPAPPGITAEQAAMAEPVAVGVWANRRGGVSAGDRVLVTGAGPVGSFAAQVARAFGATRVVVSDVNTDRLALAAALGLEAVPAGEVEGEFDVLIECSGAPVAAKTGMRRLARAGRAVLVGMGADTLEVDVPWVQGRELTITGVFRYANAYPLALQLIASGAVDALGAITHRFPLDATVDALTVARRESASLKPIVLPQR